MSTFVCVCAGFRIDPQDRLDAAVNEFSKLYNIYSVSAEFGVEFVFESPFTVSSGEGKVTQSTVIEEDVELIDEFTNMYSHDDAARSADTRMNSAYCVETQSDVDDISYDSGLGLATQRLPEGVTMESIWKIV